jgi:hypothetical protein
VRVLFPETAPPAGVPVVVLGKAGRVPPVLPGAPDPVRAAALAGIPPNFERSGSGGSTVG